MTVSRAGTTTTLASSPNPSSRKQLITLTATVAAVAPGGGLATGQVQLLDGKKKLGSFNSMGSHDLTARCGGDGNFIGSTSAVFTHTVDR
jgi:hypothetical protein